jgi:hypothetical protein
MSGFGFELLVIVRTAESGADALEVEIVARLLLVEAGIVDGPFFLGGRAHVEVKALGILVESNVAGCYARWEIGGDV